MAFNVTSWSKRVRNFGRGEPPPPGSFEYVGVAGAWEPPSARASVLSPAYVLWRAWTDWDKWNVWEISFTELEASSRWVEAIDRSVKQARGVHGDKILSAADEADWSGFTRRWAPFRADMAQPGHFNAMLKSNRQAFDRLMNEARKLADRFSAKGMSLVPVPYVNELLLVLRRVPKRMTTSDMSRVLGVGATCGEKMLAENMPWYTWLTSRDHRGLRMAIDDARRAQAIYARSRSRQTYSPGDPAYDEFLRRLTRIWAEAAGLAGVRQVQAAAAAGLADDARRFPKEAGGSLLWALGIAGAAYLGARWMLGEPPRAVAVPDAVAEED